MEPEIVEELTLFADDKSPPRLHDEDAAEELEIDEVCAKPIRLAREGECIESLFVAVVVLEDRDVNDESFVFCRLLGDEVGDVKEDVVLVDDNRCVACGK